MPILFFTHSRLLYKVDKLLEKHSGDPAQNRQASSFKCCHGVIL